jgi:hypothetical protein
MKDWIFESYFYVSSVTILAALLVLVLGMLFWPAGNRWKDTGLAVLIYIAIVALGMSGNIKHISPIGMVHALIAFMIAWLAIRHYGNRVSYIFLIPCFLMVVVIVFNLSSEGRGLELMGRWVDASVAEASASLRR